MGEYDFAIFHSAAKAVLAGLSPYSVYDFNGPYPLAVLFIPFSFLPQHLAYALFVALNVILVLVLFKKKSALAFTLVPHPFHAFRRPDRFAFGFIGQSQRTLVAGFIDCQAPGCFYRCTIFNPHVGQKRLDPGRCQRPGPGLDQLHNPAGLGSIVAFR